MTFACAAAFAVVLSAKGGALDAARIDEIAAWLPESIGYWNYGFSRHLYLGLAVRAATGGKVDLLADPRHRATVEYAYGYRLEGWKSPRIADGVGNPGSIVLALARQLFPEIGYRRSVHVDLLEGDVDAISLRAFGQEPPPTYSDGRDELPVRTWFPDAAAFSEPTAFEVPVVTYRAYARDKDPGRFALRRTAGKRRGHDMTVDVKASAPVDFRDEKITNPGRADVTRLGFAFHEPVTNATFTVVYAAGAEARLGRRP